MFSHREELIEYEDLVRLNFYQVIYLLLLMNLSLLDLEFYYSKRNKEKESLDYLVRSY